MITFNALGKFGRFGNQLFQIASTIGIATYNNQSFGFPEWEYQKYFKNRLPTYTGGYTLPVLEQGTGFNGLELGLPEKDCSLVGYYQSYKYFEHCKELIEYYLEPCIETNDYKINAIAVHVRRGDYLKLANIHPNLTLDYYNKAMSLFPNKEFMIFSDDISWCIDNFNSIKCTFVQPVDPVLDWLYMCKFSGFIISASSYSWWAAYLAKNKPVIAPSIWAFNEPKETIEDRLPKEWERIEI